MDNATALWSFAILVGLLTLTPGLDTALILRTAVLGLRRRAWGVVLGIQTGTLAQLIQSFAHPLGSTVGLKCESVVLLEISANTKWVNVGPSQLGIRNTSIGVMNHRDDPPHPVRWTAACIQRTASFARTVAREQRLANAAEELDVRRKRLSCAARWTTEDPGRPDRCEEHAVVTRVAAEERTFHFTPRWKGRAEQCRLLRRDAVRNGCGCFHAFQLNALTDRSATEKMT